MGICEPTLNMRKRGYITRVERLMIIKEYESQGSYIVV